ncbi:MAG: prolyl oligopeptidase family serine peptidase [Acidobacteria bacterium]|nr:prolyl oligopeptidase family serine peptidase [Acidobacteriota bacterium]
MRRSFLFRGPFVLCGILFALTLIPSAQGQRRYRAVRDPASPPEIPYTRYFTRDRFDRQITFYINGDQNKRLPLVASVLGSGAYSNFLREGDKIVDGHRAAREAFGGKAHILIVEKPGIEFLEQHGPEGSPNGTASGASPEFLRENTLERWAEAVSAALQAARRLPLADPSQTLLIGHSEGGIVVSLVAAENKFVTHVASLSGTGPSILFELMQKAREGRLYSNLPPDSDKQMARLLADVAAVQAEPASTTKLVLGHSHLYWSSRWPLSETEILSRVKARIFLAHGTADRNVAVANFDLLYAHLLARGKDVTAHRYEGADHGYRFADQPERDGWKEVFEAVRTWFFQ